MKIWLFVLIGILNLASCEGTNPQVEDLRQTNKSNYQSESDAIPTNETEEQDSAQSPKVDDNQGDDSRTEEIQDTKSEGDSGDSGSDDSGSDDSGSDDSGPDDSGMGDDGGSGDSGSGDSGKGDDGGNVDGSSGGNPPEIPLEVKGRLINQFTKLPLSDAKIQIGTDKNVLRTNKSGEFFFTSLPGPIELKVQFEDPICPYSKTLKVEVTKDNAGAIDIAIGHPEGVLRKVLVLNFDPIIENEGNRRVSDIMNYYNARELTDTYIKDLMLCSKFSANYKIVEWQDLDEHPEKVDGFSYDDSTFMKVLRGQATGHSPDTMNYRKTVDKYKLTERVDNGEFDEVIMWGAPYAGFWESNMVGPDAYFVNSGGTVTESERNFILMGLNFQVGVGLALHSYGHRSESIMRRVYGSWNTEPVHAWDYFTSLDKDNPGNSGCGNVHFPPNATRDYNYTNTTKVPSRCQTFANTWPGPIEDKTEVSKSTWTPTGYDSQRGYLKWWYWHMPDGVGDGPDGKYANWWRYIVEL